MALTGHNNYEHIFYPSLKLIFVNNIGIMEKRIQYVKHLIYVWQVNLSIKTDIRLHVRKFDIVKQRQNIPKRQLNSLVENKLTTPGQKNMKTNRQTPVHKTQYRKQKTDQTEPYQNLRVPQVLRNCKQIMLHVGKRIHMHLIHLPLIQ